jgi:hypothetical protein
MWLVVIILAYLFFGFASFCDKLVLAGKPKPISYTFYVGAFSLVVIFLIPFTKFGFPSFEALLWIVLNAIVHIVAIYLMYVAIEKFDVSRVIATIGATQPLFILILTWLFWGAQTILLTNILAFVLLLLGSIIISLEKSIKITVDYLKVALLASIMFSLDYILLKLVFLNQPFLQGIIWVGIFLFLVAMVFLLKKSFRQDIFSRKMVFNKKTDVLFVLAQASGGLGNFLQSFAISLAPVAFLATINSLRGIQYIFLFLLTVFVSYFYPKILEESLSVKIILQKVIAIIFIAVGLVMLAI